MEMMAPSDPGTIRTRARLKDAMNDALSERGFTQCAQYVYGIGTVGRTVPIR